MVNVKVPGKLYLAGEYAVVEPGTPAVITAVDRFVHLKITSATATGTIYSHQYQTMPVKWHRTAHRQIQLEDDVHLEFVLEAIRLTERYVEESGRQLQFFNLEIDSGLDSDDGKKFGLGSSAAVTVGVVKAIAVFYHLNLTALEIYKIAALAHYNVQGNGSLGDIAASAFTGWIAYYSPDRNWLLNQPQKPLKPLIETDWPELKIQRLPVPASTALIVGWTGAPASTKHLVTEVKRRSHLKYDTFVTQSAQCVEDLIHAIKNDDFEKMTAAITRNRKLLNELSKISHIELETPRLKKLINLVVGFGGSGKMSGAGGGDCGIGFVKHGLNYQQIFEQWRQAQILPLQLSTYTSNEE